MKRIYKRLLVPTMAAPLALAGLGMGAAYADGVFNGVAPSTYDPGHTFLVQSEWVSGIGCPTDATVVSAAGAKSTYTDPACPTGDKRDKTNQGLLLAKTGPTTNNAAAIAQLRGISGTTLTQLGFDIRKPAATADPRGSHCGAGAPRFDVVTKDGTTYFLGCAAATTKTVGNGWLRLRFGNSAGTTLNAYGPKGLTNIAGMSVKSIAIVMDEGQDVGPDNFGLAVLDNIDVNGTLVGHGPQRPGHRGQGRGEGHGQGHGQGHGEGQGH